MAFMLTLLIILGLMDALIPLNVMIGAYDLYPLSEVFGLATTLPFLAVSARRLHDAGQSSKTFILVMAVVLIAIYLFMAYEMISGIYVSEGLPFMIAAFASLATLIAILVMAAKKSQPQDNLWGPFEGTDQ